MNIYSKRKSCVFVHFCSVLFFLSFFVYDSYSIHASTAFLLRPSHFFLFFLSFNSSTKTSIFQFQSPPSWLQIAVAATATTRAEAVAIDSYCALYIVFLCCEFFEWFCNHIVVVEGVFLASEIPLRTLNRNQILKIYQWNCLKYTQKTTKISSCAVLFYYTYRHISF